MPAPRPPNPPNPLRPFDYDARRPKRPWWAVALDAAGPALRLLVVVAAILFGATALVGGACYAILQGGSHG